MKKIFFLLFIFFTIFVSVCSSTNEQTNVSVTNKSDNNKQSANNSPMPGKDNVTQNTSAMKLYNNAKHSFSIEIPQEFDYVNPKSPNTIMSAVDRVNIANINVRITDIDEQITAEEFHNLVAKEPQSLNSPGKIVDSGIINVQNNKVSYITCVLKGKSSDIIFQQFYILDKNKMFAIGYGAPKEYFNKHKLLFEKSIKTFKSEV